MNWTEKAETIGGLLEKSLLHARTVELLEKESVPVAVGCSGGVDSLAALLLVYAHMPHLRDRMTVLHFNHLLRGEDSDEDAVFVEKVADSLGLPFKLGRWEDRDPEKPISEAFAREARQAFFDTFVAETGKAIIVTGHQPNDVLETLMLRIARASNLGGLSAPRPISKFLNGKTIVRPLLDISKEKLREAMESAEIEWREDTSNQESHYARNRLRNDIIPSWQAATQFNLVQAASQVRDYLEEADEVIDRYLAFSRYPPPSCNPVDLPIRLGPKAVLRRWLALWSQGLAFGTLMPSVVNEILATLYKGGTRQWSVGKGLLKVEGSRISFEATPSESPDWDEPIAISPEGTISLPNRARLSAKLIQSYDSLLEDLENGKYSEDSTVLIDSDHLNKHAPFARAWTPGDRYQALNAPGSRKLQDMFVDRKISREERKNLPVVITDDSVILWCPGLPVNHEYRITEKTKEILQLTYTSPH